MTWWWPGVATTAWWRPPTWPAPATLARLLGEVPAGAAPAGEPEGAQLKINMVLARLPALRDAAVSSRDAFTGTFHVNEGYAELDTAYQQAAGGQIPARPPCEAYCHSLTDPSILGAGLAGAGAHTMTVFGLHMPARLFPADPAGAREQALVATLGSIDAVLAEPLAGCLLPDADGRPCLEVKTPADLEAEVGLPGATSGMGIWPGRSRMTRPTWAAGEWRRRTHGCWSAGRAPAGAAG